MLPLDVHNYEGSATASTDPATGLAQIYFRMNIFVRQGPHSTELKITVGRGSASKQGCQTPEGLQPAQCFPFSNSKVSV